MQGKYHLPQYKTSSQVCVVSVPGSGKMEKHWKKSQRQRKWVVRSRNGILARKAIRTVRKVVNEVTGTGSVYMDAVGTANG